MGIISRIKLAYFAQILNLLPGVNFAGFFFMIKFHPSFYTLSPIIGVCLVVWFSDKNEVVGKILSSKLFVKNWFFLMVSLAKFLLSIE